MLEPEVIKLDRRCLQGITTDRSRRSYLERLLRVTDTLSTSTTRSMAPPG